MTNVGVNDNVVPVPKTVPRLFRHVVVTVSASPSGSDALTEQVKAVDVVIVPAGKMVTVEITGAELPTTTVSNAVSLPPSASVAVTRHWTESPGETNVDVNPRVVPLPNVVPAVLVQTYAKVGAPPSGSDAVAPHVSEVEVVTLEDGVINTDVTTGAVLSTLTLSVPVSIPPSASVAVAVQTMLSPGAAVAGVSVRLLPVPKVVPVAVAHM